MNAAHATLSKKKIYDEHRDYIPDYLSTAYHHLHQINRMIHFTSKKRLYRQVYPNVEQISFMHEFLPILCQRYQCAVIPVPSFRALNRVGVFRFT